MDEKDTFDTDAAAEGAAGDALAEGGKPEAAARTEAGASGDVPAPASSFAALGLSQAMLEAVRDLGYEEPTPVQAEAIPLVLEGRDVMAAAQTGTGKTAAFLLPAMDRLPHAKQVGARGREVAQGPFMLVVTPTRELAQQIEEVCRTIASHTGHTCATVVGGVSYNPQRDALKRGCDILIATPGRLLDLIDQECCALDQVRVLVLDEADRMLDMGFLPSVRKIVGYTSEVRQTLLFSATLDEKAIGGITDLVRNPARVEIAPATVPTETVAQYVLPVSTEAKNGMLAQVLKREGAHRVIVFTRTKRRADTCCKRLARAGFTCAAIHGNRSQNQRERALEQFRSGEVDVLVATDVLARGIDISDVSYVVNFDVPEEPVDYIHRIGRTGRAGETGWSLTFVTPEDVGELYDIEALMGRTVETFDTRGLDLGESPPRLDPRRIPAKHMATKAQKRRRKQQNASRAQARAGTRQNQNRSGNAGQGREARGGDELLNRGEARARAVRADGRGDSMGGRSAGSSGRGGGGGGRSSSGSGSSRSSGGSSGRSGGSGQNRGGGSSRSGQSQGRSSGGSRSSGGQNRGGSYGGNGGGSQGRGSSGQGRNGGSQGRGSSGQGRNGSHGGSQNHSGGQNRNGNYGGSQSRNGGGSGHSGSQGRGYDQGRGYEDDRGYGSEGYGNGRGDDLHQTGRASTRDGKQQLDRASGSQKRQGGRASGSNKKQAGSGSSSGGRGGSGSGNRGGQGGNRNGGQQGSGNRNQGANGGQGRNGGQQSGGRNGGQGASGDDVAFEGSTRSASDAWRNYDEPSARDARLYNATTPNENRAESRTGRHPGDGGGDL